MLNSQILIVGISHEHILTIIEAYSPTRILLISSASLNSKNLVLLKYIKSLGLDGEIAYINPFESSTIQQMETIMSGEIEFVREKYPNCQIFIGLTGGTNLMVAGASLAAKKFHLVGHYVNKNNNRIITFNFDD